MPPLATPPRAGASPWPIGIPYRSCGQSAGQGRQGKAYQCQSETRWIHGELVPLLAFVRISILHSVPGRPEHVNTHAGTMRRWDRDKHRRRSKPARYGECYCGHTLWSQNAFRQAEWKPSSDVQGGGATRLTSWGNSSQQPSVLQKKGRRGEQLQDPRPHVWKDACSLGVFAHTTGTSIVSLARGRHHGLVYRPKRQ